MPGAGRGGRRAGAHHRAGRSHATSGSWPIRPPRRRSGSPSIPGRRWCRARWRVSGGDDPFPPVARRWPSASWSMVGRTPRMAALHGALRRPPTWRCVGDAAGAAVGGPRGRGGLGVLKPSHADAAAVCRRAPGVLHDRQPTTGAPTDYTGTDLQNDDAFLSWLGRLEGAIPTYGDDANTPLSILLAQPRHRRGRHDRGRGQRAGGCPGGGPGGRRPRTCNRAATGRGGGGRGRPRRGGLDPATLLGCGPARAGWTAPSTDSPPSSRREPDCPLPT